MQRKGLIIGLYILVSSCLLLNGFTEGVTYKVEGDNTKITLKDSQYDGVTVQWGDGGELFNFGTTAGSTVCSNSAGGFITCVKTYEDGLSLHNVTINNTSNITILKLDDANINEFTDFEGLGNVIELSLDSNHIQLKQDDFDIPKLTYLTLTNNGITSVPTYFSRKMKAIRILDLSNNQISSIGNNAFYNLGYNNTDGFTIDLTNNLLETIPSEIWSMSQKSITLGPSLSNSIEYKNTSNPIRRTILINNPINFIKITDPDPYYRDDTEYNFIRFGYSHEHPTGLAYTYTLKKNTSTTQTGTTSNTGVNISGFRDGSYEFKVCMNDVSVSEDIKCDTLDFYNELEGTIKLTRAPTDNPITSKDITISWTVSGYPTDYISGYTYSIKKGSTTINGTTTSTTTGFDITKLFPDYNGNYTFTVNLINKDNNVGGNANTGFSVNINSTLRITKPVDTIINASNVTGVEVIFEWEGDSVLAAKYHYTLTGKNNQLIVDETEDRTQFAHTLGVGEYTLHVKMLNADDHEISGAEDSKTITIDIPSTIEIISPLSGSAVGLAKTIFKWEGFTPHTLNNYSYTLKKGTETITGGTTNNTGFEYLNLADGEYTFDVTMHYNDGANKTKTDSSKFIVNSNSGMYLNITAPTAGDHTYNNVTGVNMTFTWNGGGTTRFSGYVYTLKKGTETITGGITKNLESGGFQRVLPSGTYTFHVDMLDNQNSSMIDRERTFTIIIPPSLTISKPIPGLQTSKDVEFNWTGFAEFFGHYQYILSGYNGSTVKTGQDNVGKDTTYFKINNLHHGQYKFTVNIIKTGTTNDVIIGKSVEFSIFDDVGLATQILQGDTPIGDDPLRSNTGTFSWYGQSEDFSGYYYSITGTTFTGAKYEKTGFQFGETSGNTVLTDLSTGKYKFTVKMLSGPDKDADVITGKTIDFSVAVPGWVEIRSPAAGSTLQSSTATFSWTGYNDIKPVYSYTIQRGSTVLDTNNFIEGTSFSRNDLTDGNYTFTVYMFSGGIIASDTINFTVSIPVKSSGGGGSSSKSHPTNNLKLSIGNESPSANEWIELIVKIDNKYTGKVTFPKIQYYSGSKWIDIPVTSKNYISDYSDDAKLGYVKFSSDDDGKKTLSQFIKFVRNGHYRIYAEDKDGYDTYVQLQIGPKKVEVDTGHNAAPDTDEEIYIARSCKKYTIIYSDTLDIYTSPNLNISEFFMNKDYLKRYLDSKNRYQSGCPTNIGWITTSYVDRTNDDERYTAPNGKVYFIVGQEGDYYSNELNRELKTPTSFRSIQELKYYIRDRNPLINMAALGPVS